jgi:hypothetical protein
MHRAAATGLVAVVLALVAPSCAQGDASTTAEVSAADPNGSADDSGAPDAPGSVVVPPGCKPSPEICNGKDDNCDGRIDEGFDADGDGTPSCAVGTTPADCDDKDPAIHPGAPETCNNKDDDCDGTIDDGFDADNDGFYACAHGTLAVDCNDKDATVHPGATEVCNGKDDDCNGKIDELPALLNGSLAVPVNPHWVTAGAASISSGWAQLTSNAPLYQAGALWWNAPYTFDTFDVSATIWIQNKADGADGMAFAWVPGNTNTVGAHGSAWGLGGLQGYGVLIDTFNHPGEPAVPFLAIVTGASTPVTLARATIPNVRDALNHVLRVRLAAGKVSVWLDTINYVFELPLPGYVPFSGRWGFTAGTGAATEAHWVQDVAMSFPDGQGCVP